VNQPGVAGDVANVTGNDEDLAGHVLGLVVEPRKVRRTLPHFQVQKNGLLCRFFGGEWKHAAPDDQDHRPTLPIKRRRAHSCHEESWGDFAMRTSNDGPTIDVLLENLQDGDQVVRLHAATVLGAMGDDAADAVPFLIDLLKSDDIQDRRLAALTLGEIGPAAEEAIEPLLVAAEDEDDGVAEMALAALEQIDVFEDDEDAEAA